MFVEYLFALPLLFLAEYTDFLQAMVRQFLGAYCSGRRSQWPRGLGINLHSNSGIMGLNPTQGMDVCVCLFCVCVILCVGRGLATG
jgi:hypothetical protein